jgi:hypothetical protein
VIFTILPTIGRDAGGVDVAQIAVLDLQTHTQTVVVRGGLQAHYVASGHLVYAAGGALRAIAFDPLMLTTRGTPVPVVTDVVINAGFTSKRSSRMTARSPTYGDPARQWQRSGHWSGLIDKDERRRSPHRRAPMSTRESAPTAAA